MDHIRIIVYFTIVKFHLKNYFFDFLMSRESKENLQEIEKKTNNKQSSEGNVKEDSKPSADSSKSAKGSSETLPIKELFKYTDNIDILLYCIGIVSALICGVCHPVAMIFVRRLFDQFQLIELLEESEVSIISYFCRLKKLLQIIQYMY